MNFRFNFVAGEEVINVRIVMKPRIDEGFFGNLPHGNAVGLNQRMPGRQERHKLCFHQWEKVAVVGVLRKKGAVERAVSQPLDEFGICAFNR